MNIPVVSRSEDTPSTSTTTATRSISWPAVFVLAVWAGMTIAAVAFVAKYSRNCPDMDEWEIVSRLTRTRPIWIRWLFAPHNEHRIPLPRLILIGAGRLSGNDFRTAAFLNVALLSAT